MPENDGNDEIKKKAITMNLTTLDLKLRITRMQMSLIFGI